MNKLKGTIIFYVVSALVLYGLDKLSPGQHDGGLGFGGLAVILFVLTVFVLMCVNLYKGIQQSKEYFLLAGIHLLVLLGLVGKLFL